MVVVMIMILIQFLWSPQGPMKRMLIVPVPVGLILPTPVGHILPHWQQQQRQVAKKSSVNCLRGLHQPPGFMLQLSLRQERV